MKASLLSLMNLKPVWPWLTQIPVLLSTLWKGDRPLKIWVWIVDNIWSLWKRLKLW